MKILEIIAESKTTSQKPRNFVAKNAMKTTSGAGAHKDKKRAEKQGEVKHKKDKVPMESATTASTSAAHVNVGAIYSNKKGKTPKNKDGTAKNALDMGANLLTGGSIKRR